MKKILALIALVVVPMSAAFAGPEDWQPAVTYVANTTQIPYQLLSFRFDYAEISADQTKLVMDARYRDLAAGEYTLTKYAKHTEERNNFVGEKIIMKNWDAGCGAGEIAKVIISGQEESLGIYLKGLDIKVEYTTTPDTCHSRPETKVITYSVQQ